LTLPCTLPKRKLLVTLLVLLAFTPRNHRARDTILSLRIKLLNFDLESLHDKCVNVVSKRDIVMVSSYVTSFTIADVLIKIVNRVLAEEDIDFFILGGRHQVIVS
jgi:hypothetical protein